MAAGAVPKCRNCQSGQLFELPVECKYQDTIMAIVNGTLDADSTWKCDNCTEGNNAVHAWCQHCDIGRPLDSIKPLDKAIETTKKNDNKSDEETCTKEMKEQEI